MLKTTLCYLCMLLFIAADTAQATEVPSSARSRKAIKAVTPQLQKELKEKSLSLGSPIFLRIFKESSELEVWIQKGETFESFKTYKICTFSGDLGPKQKTGDRQAPEGFYFVRSNALNPSSSYHLSFNLGYPNAYDRAHGRTGDYLMVHGDCVSIGCYAMTDSGINEIYTLADAALRGGQPYFRVHIFPFRMTEANMTRHKSSEWESFWLNLKEGYTFFEDAKVPPNVEVKDSRYTFEQP